VYNISIRKGDVILMTNAHKILAEEILKLPTEKVGKALSFVKYLHLEQEMELALDEGEEGELYDILANEETISSEDMLAKIKGIKQ